MTVLVEVDPFGIIMRAPPIVRKFTGQPVENLRSWMSKQPGYKEEYA